jgi:S-formylglutathione hydrolase
LLSPSLLTDTIIPRLIYPYSTMSLEKQSSNRVSTGTLTKYTFPSTTLSLPTNINVFLPTSASSSSPVPVIFYLAGLTCNEDTGAQKGGILNKAGEEGLGVVFLDTSPRGAGVEGEDKDWDLGTGESRVSFGLALVLIC